MFPPVKRVLFRESLEEIIPRQELEPLSEASDSDSGVKRRRPQSSNDDNSENHIFDEGNKSPTPIHGRRKRHREWIWRPLEDDILVSQDTEKFPNMADPENVITIQENAEPVHLGNP